MLERIKGNIEANREGFSLAEMLIVLLIISFLVLAMPPIVHKKVQKRITRGEHGRYECWVSPQDMTVDGVKYDEGTTYEYYATEKNGPCKDCGPKDNPKGYVPAGGRCTFKPKEMAPNAAYFSFNVIGGGAGGSYAPYDASDKMYKDEEAADSANVRLGKYVCTEGSPNIDGTCSNSSSMYPGGENPANWSWYGKIYPAGNGSCDSVESSRLSYELPDGTYNHFTGYADTTYHFAYNYKNSIDAYNELPRTADWVKYYWVPVSLENNSLQFCSGNGYTGTPISVVPTTGSEYIRYYYGGPGGKGTCVSLKPKELLPVGVNYPSLGVDNYFKVARGTRKNPEYFFYVKQSGAIKMTSTEKSALTVDGKTYPAPATNPEPKVSTGGVVPLPAAITAIAPSGCGPSYEGNFVYLGGTGDNPDLLVLPGANGHYAMSGVPTEDSQNGKTVTIGDETINFRGVNAATRISDSINSETSIWQVSKQENDSFDASFPNLEGSNLFPSSIRMTRKYGFDSTTFGYPGEPGESISMFLPNLTGNLTFEIGQGGEKGTAGHKTGGSGSNTYVKNSDGVNIFTAKGGVGHMGGEVGSKVLLFGEDTITGRERGGGNPLGLDPLCKDFGTKTDKYGMPLLIDGCLDKGARDNEKRFSADSGFYTILELDSETKTPSVINKLYGSIDDGGTGMLPGSGGDGGYSFLRDTRGAEHILFTNHPNANKTDYDYPYTYTDRTGTKHQTITQKYICYRKKENIGEASGKKVNNPATVCEPSIGYPGAVVIVW